MTIISVIVGSTRQGRFSEKPSQWTFQHLRKREEIEARLLDLRDFPMPFFDQPLPPAMPGRPPYADDVVQKWTAQIAASDGFVFAPKYNYGPSAVLKNALDWVYPESATARDCGRAPIGTYSLFRPHSTSRPLGAFPGRGRGQGPR